ncbi:MAG: hypothetical protein P4L85_27030 [Paludisphaera borealis]|uniref:hypothetical protein n=1 Tax=Paludisphaera borealis TaxID=1387353 RepID=UPI0028484E1C|nr:hypothetical protein [Paludisphaera borealis]MDR3623036.1 hypothetical protein [Paludisphaera borealis]
MRSARSNHTSNQCSSYNRLAKEPDAFSSILSVYHAARFRTEIPPISAKNPEACWRSAGRAGMIGFQRALPAIESSSKETVN